MISYLEIEYFNYYLTFAFIVYNYCIKSRLYSSSSSNSNSNSNFEFDFDFNSEFLFLPFVR